MIARAPLTHAACTSDTGPTGQAEEPMTVPGDNLTTKIEAPLTRSAGPFLWIVAHALFPSP